MPGRDGAKTGACLPPILPSSVKTASRAGGRGESGQLTYGPHNGHTRTGTSLENVEFTGSSWVTGSFAGRPQGLGMAGVWGTQ